MKKCSKSHGGQDVIYKGTGREIEKYIGMRIYKLAQAKHEQGIPLKKGQLVRLTGIEGIPDGSIFEVERDVEFSNDFNTWGSVKLVGMYPPIFTHKGGIELISQEVNPDTCSN